MEEKKFEVILRVLAEKIEALEIDNALYKWQVADLTAKLEKAESKCAEVTAENEKAVAHIAKLLADSHAADAERAEDESERLGA